MKTIIRDIEKNREDYKKIETLAIKEAGAILRGGGVVAFPTETVYGLGADALNQEASKKIYDAKGRPSDNPLIIHIADIKDVYRVASNISNKAVRVMDKFWPGPITLVLEKQKHVPKSTTGGLDTVAVRMPDHTIAREIIAAGGGFICAPSANLSGKPSPTLAKHVIEDMMGRIDMIFAHDNVTIGVESTILDMTVDPPMILRPGAVTKEMLEQEVDKIDLDLTIVKADTNQAPKAPGMKYRHYAPKGVLTIIEGNIGDAANYINSAVKEKISSGYKVGVITGANNQHLYQHGIVKPMGDTVEDIATNLYQILREFDELGVEHIYSESFSEGNMGVAVMNRLNKAAGYNIVKV